MCGRFVSASSPQILVGRFGVAESAIEVHEPDYNVTPRAWVPAVRERARDDPPTRVLSLLRWGLVPSWAKDPAIGNRLINARVETAAEKPAFRKAFASRRCLLPADGFYEWYPPEQEAEDESGEGRGKKKRPRKQPFFSHRADGSVLAMAGLYEIWRDPTRDEDDPDRFRWTCTVLTTEAEDAVGHIHDRMPLVVERDRWEEWLDPRHGGDTSLLVPAAPGRLEAYPVSTLVSNVRNNGPELIEPLPLEEPQP